MESVEEWARVLVPESVVEWEQQRELYYFSNNRRTSV
jgi:hypothetical protein